MRKKSPDWGNVLPKIEPNKKYLRKQQYKANLQARLDARETRLDDKSKSRKDSKSKRKVSRKESTPDSVKRTRKTVKSNKTVIANAVTGRETMRKTHAKELVQKEKQALKEKLLKKQAKVMERSRAAKAESANDKTSTAVRSAKLSGARPKIITDACGQTTIGRQTVDSSESGASTPSSRPVATHAAESSRTATPKHKVPDTTSCGVTSSSSLLSPPNGTGAALLAATASAAATSSAAATVRSKAEERALIARTIRGSGTDAGQNDRYSINNDPTLCPSLSFFDEYVEKRNAEAVSQDELLQQAHQYFKKINKQDKKLYKAAALRLKQLKEINRRGGDKDGFRYVVPRNVREMAEQMRTAYGGSVLDSTGAVVDTDTLPSTFDTVGAQESGLSDKPMRRMRRRRSTFSDFYQFQVSKQWTRNAENFLKRGRVNKSMFEAKKRQRSIRKL